MLSGMSEKTNVSMNVMRSNKMRTTSLVLLILGGIVMSTGCSIPVCCVPDIDEPPSRPMTEAEKRQKLISDSLDYFANRQFDELIKLYASEVRPQFKKSIQEKGPKMTDKEISDYVEVMNEFEFSKETNLRGSNGWSLAYRAKDSGGRFIVYFILKEEGEYRILEQRRTNIF